jgi:hypothetical protein
MKRFHVLLMAFTLVAATATSALCANVAGWSLGSYKIQAASAEPSLAHNPAKDESAQFFAQAGSARSTEVRDARSTMDPLLFDDPLKSSTGVEDRTSNDPKASTNGADFPGSNGKAEGCENGQAKGNKHCVASSSK